MPPSTRVSICTAATSFLMCFHCLPDSFLQRYGKKGEGDRHGQKRQMRYSRSLHEGNSKDAIRK